METFYREMKGKDMVLQYFMTKQEGGKDRRPLFGIKVVKKSGKRTEVESTGAVSEKETQVHTLLEVLCRNRVTPRVLNEVVDDLLPYACAFSEILL